MVSNVQYGGDEVSALVLDIGKSTVRAGYAGEDTPKCVFPTDYAITEDGKYIHGNNVYMYRPKAVIANPISDGIVADWDAVNRIFTHTFTDTMRLDSLSEYPLLTTEASWNTNENRETMAELAFEKWSAPAYYSVDKNVMSCFASGKGTALVIDIGAEGTSVVPVYDGFVLRRAIQRQPLGGDLLSRMLLDNIQNECKIDVVPHYLVKTRDTGNAVLYTDRLPSGEDSFHLAQQLNVMHDFKETVCEVLVSSPWNEEFASARGTRQYEFPNGVTSSFGNMRMSLPETFFDPSRIPERFRTETAPSPATIPSHPLTDLKSIQHLVNNSLVQIDPDLHVNLLGNVIVTGGPTLMLGFMDRLNAELTAIAGAVKLKVSAPAAPAERMYSSWIGGSILSSLGTFHQLWISKEEYDEYGKGVVNRRGK